MDNEKYGIELELITSSFNKKIQQVKNTFRGLGDKKINLNANTAQIDYLKQQIKEISSLLDYNQKKPFMNYNEVLKTRAELEKLTGQYNRLTATEKQSNASMIRNTDKLTSRLKRFGLALLSIRSIYSLVSRASSAYLSQDVDLANKLQAVWTGLGSMLAPIIERIVDILAKGVLYINIFIKALTGVDLLAKATSKSMKAAAGSAKALNKALAGFDELTNLDTDAGGGGGASLGGIDALKDVEIDTEWADKIRIFGDWVNKNGNKILSFLSGLAGALIALKLGVTPLKSLGIGLIIGGIAYSVSALLKYVKEPIWKHLGQIIQGIGIAITGVGIVITSVAGIVAGFPVIVAGAVTSIFGIIVSNWDKIRNVLYGAIDWLKSNLEWVRERFGIIGNAIYTQIINVVQLIVRQWDIIITTFKGVFDGIITFVKGVFTGNWNMAWEGVKQIFTAFINGLKAQWENLGNFFINIFQNVKNSLSSIVNGIWSVVKSAINWIIGGINKLIGGLNKIKVNTPDWLPRNRGKEFWI